MAKIPVRNATSLSRTEHSTYLQVITVYDKLVVVLQMFKRYNKTKLILPSDWPNYVEKIRPIFEPEEIEALLQHADEEEGIFLKFMLGSGFRDREAQFVTWRDIDFHHSVVRVTTKPLWGFKPKNWEERSVPLPTALIEQLVAVRDRRSALPAQLVFPNSKGRPNTENDMIINQRRFLAQPMPREVCPGRQVWERHRNCEYLVFVDESFYRFFGFAAPDENFCLGALGVPRD